MTTENFEKSLRDFNRQKPFRPFAIELSSGTAIRVDHPETVITRSGRAVHVAPDGTASLFDAGNVTRLTDAPEFVVRAFVGGQPPVADAT